MFNIILLGAPGSGKGTQAESIISDFNMDFLCMGDIVRKELSEKTELGIKMKDIIESGNLVPDDIIINMFNNSYLNLRSSSNFITDGFPRTIKQAKFLHKLNNSKSVKSIVFLIQVELKTILNRLKIRKRFDDTEDIIRHRYNTYINEISPVLDFYSNKIISIDGERSPEDVKKEIYLNLNNLLTN